MGNSRRGSHESLKKSLGLHAMEGKAVQELGWLSRMRSTRTQGALTDEIRWDTGCHMVRMQAACETTCS